MRKLKPVISALILALSPGAFALDPEVINRVLNPDTPPAPSVDCFDPETTPKCSEISSTYCMLLSRYRGRMSDESGSVNIGKSERSQLSQVERTGLDDLLRSQSRLPADLQRALARPLRDLASVLARETDSRDWYRDLARARNAIADKIRDVAGDRAKANLQGTRATKADRDAERAEQERVLNDVVTRARMESSPNWPRLQSVFTDVKRDMIAAVTALPLSEEDKAVRIARINETELSFPFAMRIGGVIGQILDQDCRHNMVNAAYISITGSLSVCAGLLNGYTSESALYFTLSHELAHSFNLKLLQTRNSRPRSANLNDRLLATNANIDCAEYAQLKASEAARGESYPCGSENTNRLVSCLNGGTAPAPEALSQKLLSTPASVLTDLDLCQLTDPSQGRVLMNPDAFTDRNFARLTSTGLQEYVGPAIPGARQLFLPAYRFTQELRCSPGSNCFEVRARTAEAVLGEAPHVPACMAAADAAAENEADWYAQKAMIIRLRNTTDLRQRRQMVAASLGLFCSYRYSRELSDRDQNRLLAELELHQNEIAADTHSDDASRLRGIMTEEVSGLLQCTEPATTNNYQACRL